MKNKTIKSAQPQGHHDDCQDCRRQKKQNEALISIYQRLQAIDNHSKLMKKSLEKHKQQCAATTNKFKQLTHKFNSLPKETRADVQLKNLGYELAQDMIEKVNNGTAIKQNQKLKRTLINVHKPRKQPYIQQIEINRNRSLSVSTDFQQQDRVNDLRYAFSMRKSVFQDSEHQLRSSRGSENIKQIPEQSQDTKTTGFFSNDPASFQKQGRAQNLNLWLYEQNNNKNLQEQLYEMRIPHRLNRQKNNLQKGAVLPALKLARNQL